MTSRDVLVVPTGAANLASVCAGIERAGGRPRLAATGSELRRAERVVLPGVGSFGAAMDALRARGFAVHLRERVQQGRPTLAICLGLQLLCASSEESPREVGLSVLPARVVALPAGVRRPQLGWNRVAPAEGCRSLEAGHAYYANSYCLRAAPPGWTAAWTDHGGPFVAALERGAVLACQFHPELSGAWGARLLRRWVAQEDVVESLPC